MPGIIEIIDKAMTMAIIATTSRMNVDTWGPGS